MDRRERHIYLTFDDGPIPTVTPFVLELLQKFNARATFFCVGENVIRYPHIFSAILEAGHRVGNHTQNHIRSGNTNVKNYLQNIYQCDETLEKIRGKEETPLFRPPYGRIGFSKIRKVRQTHQIVMWDVLTGDFDPDLEKEKCLNASIKATQNGSVIVFHDSKKAELKLRYVLPRYLAYFKSNDFTFKAL